MSQITKNYKTVKKLLKKNIFANPFTVSKYSFSPYMACQHGCVYCDGRAEKYYVEGDFEKNIVVRKNTPELLQKELTRLRETGPISIGSGITDVYQPLEEKEQLMKQCAKILLEHKYPVSLMTKSSLILRDLNLWKKINETSGFQLAISLTTIDDKLRKIFEPGASSIEERLEVIKIFKENRITVGVLALPLLPLITDTTENIINLYDTLKELKVDFIMPNGLTLRPGKQKNFFIKSIEKNFPALLNDINNLYIENKFSGSPVKSYSNNLLQKISKITPQYKIPIQIPHYTYKNKLPNYDEIFILLSHMFELYQLKGINTKPLYKAFTNYSNWLKSEKKIFNRKRSITQTELENKFITLLDSNEFITILNNSKLLHFMKEVILNNKTFDYRLLSLI